ncbi:MAG TPA: SusC/RagA family TonB-linked outer membrane protein [Puia sp.]|nr:SusC/RagA family TonB-linked outer membrane protein [Puia sp.]
MSKNIRVIMFFAAGLLCTSVLQAQVSVSGTVTNKSKQPIQGASVTIVEKGRQGTGTQTDNDGKFHITAPAGSTLQISFVGYKNTSLKVEGAGDNVNIALEEDFGKLDEVIVSGLATSVKRSNLANSIATISSKQLTGIAPAQTFDAAISGKIPGANITANSGAPGGGISIKLRGVTSIYANSQPLYVIDGVFWDNTSTQPGLNTVTIAAAGGLAASNQDNASSRISDLNPQDIENIEILKGASAAALYGSKAAAGVIIVTTKKGRAGKTKINFSQDIGQARISKLLGQRPLTDAIVTAQGWNVAEYDAYKASGKHYDYEKEIYGNKPLLSNSRLSISGGNEKTSFYAAGAIKDEKGIIDHTGYKNYSIRLNMDHKVTDKITLGFTSTYINSSSDRALTNNDNAGATIGVALSSTPNFTELHQNANGSWPRNKYAASNPLETIAEMKNNENTHRFVLGGNLNVILQQNAVSTTRAILRGGIDYYSLYTTVYFPSSLQFMVNSLKGASVQGTSSNTGINWAALLVNTFTISDKLTLTSNGGVTLEAKDQNNILSTATQLIGTQTNLDQAGALTVIQTRNKHQENGAFIQEEMNLADYLVATAGIRFDKSTNNGDRNKLFPYPKASLAWNLAKMNAWHVDNISSLKLRVAYGQSGNFPPYGTNYTNLASSNTAGNPGSLVNITFGNPNILPERQTELEGGLDIGLFNGRLNFEGTVYNKKIFDMLLLQSLPRSSGYTFEWINGGSLSNKGVELSISGQPIRTKEVQWNATLNWWKNSSKVTQLNVPPFAIGAFSNSLGTFYVKQGESTTQYYGPNGAKGFSPVGNAEPDFQMTMLNEINFLDNFSFRFLIHWKKGGDNLNLSQLLNDLGGVSKDYDEDKGHTGTTNGVARINAAGVTSPFVQDASYIRFREIGLYYNVPLHNTTTGVLKGLRLGISANNWFTITSYQGYDPEVSNFSGLGGPGTNGITTGVDVAPFPASKRMEFHLAVDF